MSNPSTSKVRRRKSAPIRLKQESCSAKIYVTSRTRNGRTYIEYTLVYSFAKRRIRRSFASEAAARQAGQEALTRLANGQIHALQLTKADADSVVWANDQLRPIGLTLFEAVSEFLAARRLMDGKGDVLEALRYFKAHGISDLKPKLVKEAVDEMLSEKSRDGLSQEHIRGLKTRLNQFASAFPRQISEIKVEEIDSWLRGLDGAPRSRNNVADAIRSLFNHVRGRYIPKTSNVGEKLARAKVIDSDILIFTPLEVRRMLQRLECTRPDLLPMALLGAFAGLRTAEIERLDWQDIDLAQGYIRISGEKTKTGERRLIPIQPALRAWLANYSSLSGPVCRLSKSQEIMQAAVEKNITFDDGTQIPGVAWKKNGLRHSYGSYRIQVIKNIHELSLEMGNSPQMIQKHYRELVTDAQAAEYWSIFPEATSAQVIAMPSAS